MSENGARRDLEIVLPDGRTLVIDRYAISHQEVLAIDEKRAAREKAARHHGYLVEALKASPADLGLIQTVEKAEDDYNAAFDEAKAANDEKVAKMVGLTAEELIALPQVVYDEIQSAVLQVLRRERGVDPN